MPWTTLGLIGGAVVLGGVLVLALVSLFSPGPGQLGVTAGRLAPCPASPNCVCSQATDPTHAIEPIPFKCKANDARERLRTILTGMSRVRIVSEDETYLRAECTTLVFRFVDDVEFLIDAESQVIHFRSASRAGSSDLGVNRKRMEAIRKAFNQG